MPRTCQRSVRIFFLSRSPSSPPRTTLLAPFIGRSECLRCASLRLVSSRIARRTAFPRRSRRRRESFSFQFLEMKIFSPRVFVPRPGSMVWYSFGYVIGVQERVLVVQFDAWWVCNSWRWADDGRIGGRRIDRLFLALVVVVVISFVPRKNSYLALSASMSIIRGRCSLRLALFLLRNR